MTPPAYPHYLFKGRTGHVFGTVPYRKKLTPLEAVYQVFQGCDFYPYEYRAVEHGDPAATLDVYICKAPGSTTYVATLATIDPACCFCGGPMQLAEETPWLYGFQAWPVSDEQCCSGCFTTKVQPARAAQRLAEEARYRT